MGNCGNKPLTSEGELGPAPEQKGVDETSREIEMDQNKVIAHAHQPPNPPSLAQMLEDDGKKLEAGGPTKPVEEKPSEPAKLEEVAKEVVVEPKTEDIPMLAAEPPKAEATESKKEETKSAEVPAASPAEAGKKKEEKKPEVK